jgi:hypothetical protein
VWALGRMSASLPLVCGTFAEHSFDNQMTIRCIRNHDQRVQFCMGTEGGNNMWMRSCAVCKVLLRKLRLTDSIRCQCGWEWQGH